MACRAEDIYGAVNGASSLRPTVSASGAGRRQEEYGGMVRAG